ncbi:restriction endonuclease subunit S [Lentimicrobium sp. S6]|uniref:restriction endonuclease subunit S n=1 Tax=Lentimicrobium sp. S6 TaxID=2735872 RepID=UPI0015542467|nr:restriction endonuclease subunit S [Lentimicrobium sp. S6]NPD47055.1 restriction endonuclease subunit S [Lentimicrobium sp. S6]
MQLKYNKYPTYKDSGVEWLGEIPEHWEARRVKSIFRLVIEPAEKDNNEELLSVYTDIGVRPRKELAERGNKASTTDGYWKVKKGDVIVNKLLAWMGAIGISNYNGVTSPAYDILRPRQNINGGFYHNLFRTSTCISELKKHSRGIMNMRLRLYFDKFGDVVVPLPPIEEQNTIAQHLDQKTKKIDQAISQKEKMIALLKERKQIMIQELVTGKIVWDKETDSWIKPKQTKDSGVEWIGEIPEGWEVKRLKYLIKNLESGVSVNASETESAKDDEIGVLKTSSVYKYSFDKNENKKVFKSDLKRVKCPVIKGRIIISRMNAPDLVGASGYARESHTNLFLPDRLWQTVYHSNLKFDSIWLSIVMTNVSFRKVVTSYANGSSPSMKNISKPDLLNISIPFPKFKEQSKLVEGIEIQSTKIDQTIALQQKQIERLKEYKMVLIDSLVTGKVKI